MPGKGASTGTLIGSMSSICGIDHITVSEDVFSAHGFPPRNRPQLLVSPGSVEEVQEIVRCAAASGVALIAIGGGTQIAQVLGRLRRSIAISTSRLDRVSECEPDNLSLTCESGCLPATLCKLTAPHNLQLPVTSDFHHATIGGLVASNFSGWKRYRYGASRDYVMGLSFVSAEGKHVSTGGKTVKNVSGYDFTRLLSGSWGRFGIITSVTLKLLPLPAKEIVAVKDFCTVEEALDAGVDILAKVTDPCSCNLVSTVNHPDIRLVLVLEGSPELVSSQLEDLQLSSGWRLAAKKDECQTTADEYVGRRRKVKSDIYHTAAVNKGFLPETRTLLRLLAESGCCYDFDLSAGLLEFSSPANTAVAGAKEFEKAWFSAAAAHGRIRHTLGPAPNTSAMFSRILKKLDPHSIMFPDNVYSAGGGRG